jgi:hypothetical protein
MTLSTGDLGVRLFMLRAFSRFASREGMTNDVLKSVVALMKDSIAGANLGGFVY